MYKDTYFVAVPTVKQASFHRTCIKKKKTQTKPNQTNTKAYNTHSLSLSLMWRKVAIEEGKKCEKNENGVGWVFIDIKKDYSNGGWVLGWGWRPSNNEKKETLKLR